MDRITANNLARLFFTMKWRSSHALHTDCYSARKVNFWLDLFPEAVYEMLMGTREGEQLSLETDTPGIVPPYDSSYEFVVDHRQFNHRHASSVIAGPRYGRFYPRGILRAIPGVFQSNQEPFRCTGINGEGITVDFNHPLAIHEVGLTIDVKEIRQKAGEAGGACTAWFEVIIGGPGMQGRCRGSATDFFSDDPFSRPDEEDDAEFYTAPRLVTHIDDRAISVIGELYGRLLREDMKVLDLMSSWKSHIPESLRLDDLIGLGLNEQEMSQNPALSEYVIHDLNKNPMLPFGGEEFDAVICTVSVEYLTRPLEVFEDIARLLRPEGVCVMTFSNRWFPPKVVRIWTELHEFERLGLVSEYFLRSSRFREVETFSMRGLTRPENDPYFPRLITSDPVYAVWAKRA